METTAIMQDKKELHALSLRKVLLFCGILYPLIYIAADMLGTLSYEDYSYFSQNVSEILAIDSPVRPFTLPVFNLSDLILIAFSAGVWLTAGQKRSLRTTGILLVMCAVTGFVTSIFFPMHLRDAEKTLTDTMHIILTSVLSLFILASIGFGGASFGKRFRIYSIVTIAVLLVFGALTGIQGPKIGTGMPTPWMGITERVNIYNYIIWVLVLALMLLRIEKGNGKPPVH